MERKSAMWKTVWMAAVMVLTLLWIRQKTVEWGLQSGELWEHLVQAIEDGAQPVEAVFGGIREWLYE